jgi:DNA-binding CsgD family transcriptional regulator/tetratricopeptide (TPR) repeat protein
LDTEHDNLRGAITWAIEHDPELALQLAAGLWRFWEKRGHWTEGRTWLERTLARSADAPPAIRATALSGLANLATAQGDYTRADYCLQAALPLWEALSDQLGVARTLRDRGVIASYQGELDQADSLFRQAYERLRVLDVPKLIAKINNDLGVVAYRQGNLRAAITFYEAAMTAARAAADDWTVSLILSNLGGVYDRLGDRARGAELTEDALGLARRLGDQIGISHSQFGLATFALRSGRVAESIDRFVESLTIARDLRSLALATRVLDGLAAVAVECRQFEAAARLLGASTALREAAGDSLDPTEVADRAEIETAARKQLGAAPFATAWEVGRRMDLDEAIAASQTIVARATATTVNSPASSAPPTRSNNADALLTTREAEVLQLLVEGRSDREIAEALFLSRPTVSKHVSSILGKIGVSTRAAAAAVAVRDHLI